MGLSRLLVSMMMVMMVMMMMPCVLVVFNMAVDLVAVFARCLQLHGDVPDAVFPQFLTHRLLDGVPVVTIG
jgi:hypothetical protein